jgi:ACS family glucarate transporter-like MFS transporter
MQEHKASHTTDVISSETIPRYRFVVISILWITAIFLYFDRVNISMAAPHIMADLDFSGVEMGLVLSMFSWGYVPGQLLGGFVADRYGIRKWALFWYLIWCIATLGTGLCRSLGQLLGMRFLFGFSEGTVINQVNKMQNHWAFPKERGFVNGGMMFAAYFGLVAGVPLVAWLIEKVGWQGMFYVSGAITVIGVFLFWLFVYDYPADHPRVSEQEKRALAESLAKDRIQFAAKPGEKPVESFKDNLAQLLKNPIYWAMCGSFFFANMIYYTNFSWLPSYLQMERGFSNVGSGAALIFPYLAAAIGALSSGVISDKLDNRCLVIILGAICTIPSIAAMLMLDSQVAVIVTLCLIMFFNAATVATYVVLLFDIFPPQIVGTALAVLSGIFGGFGGITGPMLMGFSFDMTQSFYIGFAILGGGMLVSIALMSYVYTQERRIKRDKKLSTVNDLMD